jgi:hypothetical protein
MEITVLFFTIRVRHHGMPEVIVSYWNAKFPLEFCTFLWRTLGPNLSLLWFFTCKSMAKLKESMGYWTNILKIMWLSIIRLWP